MTYRELHRSHLTWIASHVAGDLLMMHKPDEEVSAADLAKVQDAKRRDDAIATLPRESCVVFPISRRS